MRYADDSVVGFEYKSDANRFLVDMRQRLEQFALLLHPDKTRLIEFGRYAIEHRAARGLANRRRSTFLDLPTSVGAPEEALSSLNGRPAEIGCAPN